MPALKVTEQRLSPSTPTAWKGGRAPDAPTCWGQEQAGCVPLSPAHRARAAAGPASGLRADQGRCLHRFCPLPPSTHRKPRPQRTWKAPLAGTENRRSPCAPTPGSPQAAAPRCPGVSSWPSAGPRCWPTRPPPPCWRQAPQCSLPAHAPRKPREPTARTLTSQSLS